MILTIGGEPPHQEFLERLDPLLAVLLPNPIASFTAMDLGNSQAWSALDRQEIITYFQHGRYRDVELRSPLVAAEGLGLDAAIQASLSVDYRPNHPNQENSAYYWCGVRDEFALPQLDTLLTYCRRCAAQFPGFFSGRISTSEWQGYDFFKRHHLAKLPATFALYLEWFYLLTPAAYEPHCSKEVLLAAPAYSVRELDRGIIEMICFPYPQQDNASEEETRILTLARYLLDHLTPDAPRQKGPTP